MDINITSPKAIKELMERHGIAPLKRFGQNFLMDANIADKIAQAAVPEGACALEIGAGLGALTIRLAEREKRVAAYEIDSGLVRALDETLDGKENVSIIHKDFLKAEIEKELPPLFDGDIYVAANLPYYITTDCVMKLITANLPIKCITVMVQKEFAQRITERPGGQGYGVLNAAVNYRAKADVLFDVSASCFYPRPDVSSVVVKLDMHTAHQWDEDYLKTIKGLFAAKRKTVKSNLRNSFFLSQNDAEAVLKSSGIEENARAENLGVTEFLEIAKNLKSYIKNNNNLQV